MRKRPTLLAASIPTKTGVLTARGPGAGALSGSLVDFGIPDDFIKKISETIPGGSSALFVLFKGVTEDKALPVTERAVICPRGSNACFGTNSHRAATRRAL
jgi:hypothetical protein